MKPLRIALSSEALVGPPNGTRTFLENILRHWFTDSADRVDVTLVVSNDAEAKLLESRLPPGPWHSAIVPGSKWSKRLSWLAGGGNLSDTIGPHDAFLSGWHWPLGGRDRPFFGVIHDLRPLEPDWSDHTVSPVRRVAWSALYRYSARACLKRAAAIATPSRFTLKRVSQIGYRPRQPIRVIPHGIDLERWATPLCAPAMRRTLASAGLSDDISYMLAIGPQVAHKNMVALTEAFARAPASRDRDAHLVIAGAPGPETRRIEEIADRTGLQERIHLTGRVSDEILTGLMQNARIFACVSLFEGFGLPVLEAMAAGIPVLTSASTSLAEVAGDAALTVDPSSIEAITGGLNRLWTDEDLRDALVARGNQRAAQFNWGRAATDYLNFIGSVVKAET